MKKSSIDLLNSAFKTTFGERCTGYKPLPVSGSTRIYARFSSPHFQAIGMYNPGEQENDAFLYVRNKFAEHEIKVPEIYFYAEDKMHMLLSDLGDNTLFAHIQAEGVEYTEIEKWFKSAIDMLICMQTRVSASFDFKKCYPAKSFTRQSYFWDLNYFKYCFLRLQNLGLEEEALDRDFETIVQRLDADNIPHALVHRDFQSRNLMIHFDDLYVIDFQSARKGPVLYDLISLIWQAKANLPAHLRNQLLDYYLVQFNKQTGTSMQYLKEVSPYFVLFRVLQVLGAYGLRGLHEHKPHFLQSIPYAIDNLQYIFSNYSELIQNLPALAKISKHLSEIKHTYGGQLSPETKHNDLAINIASFSYKNGYPKDYSDHGGGFIFDCRSLPNPGRYAQYKTQSGLDEDVIDWLENHEEIEVYYKRMETMILEAIDVYKSRNFNYLAVNFGCTGGQHRSVYMAERLAKKISEKANVTASVKHKNKDAWPDQ